MATSSLGNLTLAAVLVIEPLLAQWHLGGPAAWAAMSTVLGIGLIVGGVLSMYLRPERQLGTGTVALTLSALPSFGLAHDGP